MKYPDPVALAKDVLAETGEFRAPYDFGDTGEAITALAEAVIALSARAEAERSGGGK